MASPQPRIGVVTYPGSQDDRDALWALAALDAEPVPVWHEESELPDLDAVVLPGGFSYGDHLRCGAIARFSPATAAVRELAEAGGLDLEVDHLADARVLHLEAEVAERRADRFALRVEDARLGPDEDGGPHPSTTVGSSR